MSAFPDPFWGEVPQERLVSLACLVNRCYWLGMKLDLGWLIQLVTPPVAHTCWKQAISFGFNPPILHGITYISCLNQHAFPKFAKFLLDFPKRVVKRSVSTIFSCVTHFPWWTFIWFPKGSMCPHSMHVFHAYYGLVSAGKWENRTPFRYSH